MSASQEPTTFNYFNVEFINTANINATDFTTYKNIMLASFTKWDSIINGVSNETLGSNFVLNVTVDINNLGVGVLGGL